MSHPNPSTALARTVIDEMARLGVRLVLVSPGSRSAALSIAAADHPEMETRVVVDERSAAFHALGAIRASNRPVVVISTSGSASTHFYPAVVEADLACQPLVTVSADRPVELQGVGANQTMGQEHLFGRKVRAYAGIEAPDSSIDRNVEWRSTVARLIGAATGMMPGPVHLNVRFREPTVPVTDDGRTRGEEYPFDTPRIDEAHVPGNRGAGAELPVVSARRGLVIAGDGVYDRSALRSAAADLGWPVLATVLSGMRSEDTVSAYHHLLAQGVPESLRPETVVAVGAIGPSQRLESLVASASERVRIDGWGRVIDPQHNATHRLHADVVDLLGRGVGVAEPGWRGSWLEADTVTKARLASILDGEREMSGAVVARALNGVAWGSLVVASSLPIREVDAHLERTGPVHSNRGVSGIDGFVSTALGVAGESPRTLGLAGDLSLLHDSNGFLNDGDIDLTLVVIDNDGGGLFDSLPQARHAPYYERLFVTPPGRDLEAFARFHRLGYTEASSPGTLSDLCEDSLGRGGIDLIRVEVNRVHDLAVRTRLDDRSTTTRSLTSDGGRSASGPA